jgi:hypothetical protein
MFYHWELISSYSDISIVSGQSAHTITVESTGSASKIPFSVKCTVNDQYTSDSKSIDCEHTKNIDVIATDISRTSGGSCCIPSGETSCEAFGVYKVDATNETTYKWTLSGSAVIDGSTTLESVTVKTTGSDEEKTFTLTCTASNQSKSDAISKSFTHGHYYAVFDQSITYDSSNIATAFVA